MASHGVPRASIPRQDKTEQSRKIENQKIQKYRDLDDLVRTKRAEKDYTEDALKKTTELLAENAEYYSVWNYRRLILESQLDSLRSNSEAADSSSVSHKDIRDVFQQELAFLFPLLRRFPKCYWIWNHRLWVLNQTISRLSESDTLSFWKEELALVGKMLSLDGRNFHGWGYRRMIVSSLESLGVGSGTTETSGQKNSLTESELQYTTKMIGTNLSNFSAWHNRSKLILKSLNEREADDAERKTMLENELKLIHRALIDPYDQSLWFYHQNLMCTFDRATATKGIAPNLSDETRLEYLYRETEAITELLDEEEDCKWIYQALLECSLIVSKIQGFQPREHNLSGWLSNLKRLDPLRKGRWEDLEKSLKI